MKCFNFQGMSPVCISGDLETTPLEKEVLRNDEVPYRELLGSLIFLANVTRLDIFYSLGVTKNISIGKPIHNEA